MEAKNYYNVRSEIKDGDIFAYNGSGFMPAAIRYFDDAYYTHVGVAKWIAGRLFTVEMWGNGIQLIPMSRRMKAYNNFCVIRPKKNLDLVISGIDLVLSKIERDVKYDFFLLPRIAVYKKTGIDLVGMGSRCRYVCSELIQVYTNQLLLDCYKDISLITPQDFIRHSSSQDVDILYDTSPKI